MGNQLQLQFRNRVPVLKSRIYQGGMSLLIAGVLVCGFTSAAQATPWSDAMNLSQKFYREGDYFKSARYAFAAAQDGNRNEKSIAYSWVTLGLVKANLFNAASYFYIRTLEGRNSEATRRVLTVTEKLLLNVGADPFRVYMNQHTRREDYNDQNRSSYLYALAKASLMNGDYEKVIDLVGGVSRSSPVWPFALQMRGTSYAVLNQGQNAVNDFKECVDVASRAVDRLEGSSEKSAEIMHRYQSAQTRDLQARCQAGVARTYYQMNQFYEADVAYDQIPKTSFVWTDILFEQAWNAFAKQEYNRALGKVVTYKHPMLKFAFNTEIEVLRAQSFLALCLYTDANQVIKDFNRKYTGVAQEVKSFVERNGTRLVPFYEVGKRAALAPLHTDRAFDQVLNRFVRGPYFQGLLSSEKAVSGELDAIRQLSLDQEGTSKDMRRGFPGFLRGVLDWRRRSLIQLGGAYVRNSMMDYHTVMVSDFEKMNFIKLEMLNRVEERLVTNRPAAAERSRGNVMPGRKDYQYWWSFIGEFWGDELGDYVFALETECRGT